MEVQCLVPVQIVDLMMDLSTVYNKALAQSRTLFSLLVRRLDHPDTNDVEVASLELCYHQRVSPPGQECSMSTRMLSKMRILSSGEELGPP